MFDPQDDAGDPGEKVTYMRVGLIGAAHNLDRQEDTVRFARTTDETKRDPHSWWEPNIPKKPPKRFGWGPPMRNAPSGAEAELQRVLLRKPTPPLSDRLRAVGQSLRALLRRSDKALVEPTSQPPSYFSSDHSKD